MKTITLEQYESQAKYIGTVQSKLTMRRSGVCEFDGARWLVQLGNYGLPVVEGKNRLVTLRKYNPDDYLIVSGFEKSTIKESIVNKKEFKQLKEALTINKRKPISKLSVSLFKEELKESKKSEPLKESLIMPISGFEYSVFKKGNLGEGSGKMVTQGIAMVEGQNVKVNGKSFSIKSYDFVGTKGY